MEYVLVLKFAKLKRFHELTSAEMSSVDTVM